MRKINSALVLVVMALLIAPVFAPSMTAKPKPRQPVVNGECMPKPPRGVAPDVCRVR